jgi:hypothetical protein
VAIWGRPRSLSDELKKISFFVFRQAAQPSHKFEKEGVLFIREKQEGFFRKTESKSHPGNTKGGKYHCTVDLLFDWFWISCLTTDNFCFYLQNRLIQTSQTGGQWYSNTSPFSIPCLTPWPICDKLARLKWSKSFCWGANQGSFLFIFFILSLSLVMQFIIMQCSAVSLRPLNILSWVV